MTVTKEVITIEVPELKWPAIYVARGQSEDTGKFGVAFDAGLVPLDWRLRMHKNTSGPSATAKSNRTPVVTERLGRYELMAMLFQEADVRNIPRDRLLQGIPGEVVLELMRVEHSYLGEFDTLVLLGVTVDVDDMKRALEAINV